jgi:hypothetical protein
MSTPKDDHLLRAAEKNFEEAKRQLSQAIGQSLAREYNAQKEARTGSVTSGARDTTAATTGNDPTASNKSAAASAATRQATSTFPPPSTDNSKL